jgi:hypothetical protein
MEATALRGLPECQRVALALRELAQLASRPRTTVSATMRDTSTAM